jgi:hypothetical protein
MKEVVKTDRKVAGGAGTKPTLGLSGMRMTPGQ